MRYLTLLIVVVLIPVKAKLQTDNVSKYIHQLYQMWDSVYSHYHFSHLEGDSIQGVRLIHSPPVRIEPDSISNILDIEQQLLKAQGDAKKGEIGLSITASYAYNLDPGIGFADDLFYTQRFRAGIGMDILKNGLFSNRVKAKIKYNELNILRYREPEEQKQYDKYVKWHNIIYQFNLKKIKVLHQREQLALQRMELATRLNFLKHVSQKDLLTVISSHAQIASMLDIYQSYNQQLASEIKVKNLTDVEFPLIDINYEYSYRLIEDDTPDTVIALMLENIQLEDKAVHDFRLRPYVAYNWYDLVQANPNFRHFVSVGVSFAAPLNFNSKNRENLTEAKAARVQTPFIQNKELKEDILTQFYEFRYKLKQFVSLFHKRKMFEELIRQENVKYKLAPLKFNPIDALGLMDNLMEIDIELLDLKQQMYLKALNIYSDLPYSKAQKLFVPITINSKVLPPDNQHHTIYIWSNSVMKYDPVIIANYIELNPLDRATVSINTQADKHLKTLELIEILYRKKIDVELMVSNNQLINGSFDKYMQSFEDYISWNQVSALHLDVEPHTQSDWKENKAKYLSQYLDLIEQARLFCDAKKVELAVSIPTHYPENIVDEVFEKADRVYFMCYENVKVDFIVRKTSLYDPSKTYIALRTNDFTNRVELEAKFQQILSRMKVAGIAIHDFDSLFEFDTNSLDKK